MVTIIDTPGFGDDIENEQNTIEELVDVLKNKVKFVHVFVLAFLSHATACALCFLWGTLDKTHFYSILVKSSSYSFS